MTYKVHVMRTGFAACTERSADLAILRRPVEKTPAVFIVFWGFKFQAAIRPANLHDGILQRRRQPG